MFLFAYYNNAKRYICLFFTVFVCFKLNLNTKACVVHWEKKNPRNFWIFFFIFFGDKFLFFSFWILLISHMKSPNCSDGITWNRSSESDGAATLMLKCNTVFKKKLVMQHENYSLLTLISPGASLLLLVYHKNITCKTTETWEPWIFLLNMFEASAMEWSCSDEIAYI